MNMVLLKICCYLYILNQMIFIPVVWVWGLGGLIKVFSSLEVYWACSDNVGLTSVFDKECIEDSTKAQ